jgi:hypothetical protein
MFQGSDICRDFLSQREHRLLYSGERGVGGLA